VMSGDAGSAAERERLLRFLHNRVTETAAAAHFADHRSMQEGHLILHSSRRADAVILEALIEDRPGSDLIPKLARGLLAHRVRGRWGHSQENSFVLVALDRYFRAFEAETPNFLARAWLGEDFAGERAFRGRSADRHHLHIPMGELAARGAQGAPLIMQKQGPGRLYYRIGMRYAPRDLELEAADHGFSVERSYRAIDDPQDVTRRDDGTWVIRAGARVEVELTMVAPTRRYHVALVDPLPAGLEAQNPRLAVTADAPTGGDDEVGPFWWWMRPWYQHQNLRDERVEAFTTMLWGGVHRYTYLARATTPGQFVAPPAKAEEMYHPETFGRSATARVEIVEP
jgi:alpha-2-macroglobulin